MYTPWLCACKNTDLTDRRAAERRGRRSERIAAISLILKGYRILAARVRTPAGEIDLIAQHGRLIAFVEVKARKTEAQALEAVSASARNRISRAAELWMSRRGDLVGFDQRFDIITVTPYRWPRHHKDAWRPEVR